MQEKLAHSDNDGADNRRESTGAQMQHIIQRTFRDDENDTRRWQQPACTPIKRYLRTGKQKNK
jgi:hypothetical protein